MADVQNDEAFGHIRYNISRRPESATIWPIEEEMGNRACHVEPCAPSPPSELVWVCKAWRNRRLVEKGRG
jgi:hypothetical protein